MADTPAEGTGRRPRKRPLDKKYRDTRTALILQSKLSGKRILEIAEEFNISKATVHRALNDAERLGLMTHARDWLSLKAMPLSLAAIEEGLVLGELPLRVDTAFRLLEGFGVLGKHATLTVEPGKGAAESFEEFRQTIIRRVNRADPAAGPGAPETAGDAALEGEVLALPETGEAAGGQGHRQDPLPRSDRPDHPDPLKDDQ